MDRGRIWQRVRRVWITLALSATVIFAGWSLIAYRASPAARVARESDAAVAVQLAGGVWRFTPTRPAPGQPVALVFFPGALVEPAAYAPLVRAVAEAGYTAWLVELPRRGALGGAGDPEVRARLRRVLRQRGAPERWVVAGHSLGGVVASEIAASRPEGLAGVVLIGTSHPRDVDLSALDVPVTKIAGTRDGVASRAKVEANRHLLPPSTQWVWVDGGNHSQFGWYGFQPGDRRATMEAAAQRALMIRAVLGALSAAADLATVRAPSAAPAARARTGDTP